MRSTVIFDEYHNKDLKPSKLLDTYLQLTEEDVKKFFVEKQQSTQSCVCPGCKSDKAVDAFVRFEMQYKQCQQCSSVYTFARPEQDLINQYYHCSSARAFWRDQLSAITKDKRKEKIIAPRMQWIMEMAQEYVPGAAHIADINTGQKEYVQALSQQTSFARKTIIAPLSDFTDSLPAVNIINDNDWDKQLQSQVDAVSLFEVIDHTSDVDQLLSKIRTILKDKGICFLTAIVISGFDLMVLWDQAANIYPPDRLNVFSVEGLRSLFSRHQFNCLEFSTPGILDVENVAAAYKNNPNIVLPRFVQYLIENRNQDIQRAFQEFLQSSLLSSYARIVLQK